MVAPVIVHKSNTRFQTENFLVNTKFTSDGIWAMMYNQHFAISHKVVQIKAKKLKKEAEILRLGSTPPVDPADALDWEANKMVFESELKNIELELLGVEDELKHIIDIMDRVSPTCKYSDLPIIDRLEASQQEEWLYELRRRAENMLISNSLGIPYDHLETMRLHPDFMNEILPHIISTGNALVMAHQKEDNEKLLQKILDNRFLLKDN